MLISQQAWRWNCCCCTFTWITFLLWGLGVEESPTWSPERPGEPAGSPQSPGWEPSLPAGRVASANRQLQGGPERRRRAKRRHPSGATQCQPRSTISASVRLKRASSERPEDKIPAGNGPAAAGTAGARAGTSRGGTVGGEEAAGIQTAGRATGLWATDGSSSATRRGRRVGEGGSGEGPGRDPEDTGRANKEQHTLQRRVYFHRHSHHHLRCLPAAQRNWLDWNQFRHTARLSVPRSHWVTGSHQIDSSMGLKRLNQYHNTSADGFHTILNQGAASSTRRCCQ